MGVFAYLEMLCQTGRRVDVPARILKADTHFYGSLMNRGPLLSQTGCAFVLLFNCMLIGPSEVVNVVFFTEHLVRLYVMSDPPSMYNYRLSSTQLL